MSWVYSVGFVGERFLMVFNPKRNGWEMPGGRVEEGETPEEAAIREVKEEAGCEFRPLARRDRRDGYVFVGQVSCPVRGAEMEWDLFSNLPAQLAFTADEYTDVLAWAKGEVTERISRGRYSSNFIY
jgi:8-oxo-dGTP diphosphatase